jgi:hypothetical protein
MKIYGCVEIVVILATVLYDQTVLLVLGSCLIDDCNIDPPFVQLAW